MKICANEKGFALITALMITMICLVITMGIMASVIQNTKSGGLAKSYQNSIEASYGGAEVQMFEILPRLLNEIFATRENAGGPVVSTSIAALMDAAAFGNVNSALVFNRLGVNNACLIAKLTTPSASWFATCAGAGVVNATDLTNTNPSNFPDFTMTLPGLRGQSYTVVSKIVDTSVGVPYIPLPGSTPTSPGAGLTGGGAVSSSASGGGSGNGTSGLSGSLAHFVYRMEVSASRTSNPQERGAVSVLYEY